MCGRFTMTYSDVEFIAAGLGVPVEQLNLYKPRYNVAPTDPHPILRMHFEEREIEWAKWGLINWWAKDAKSAFKQINARSETIDTSPAFREIFASQRCVVPTDGFFEWTGPKTDRQPLWIRPSDGGLMLMAGLWESWKVEPHVYQSTFTIITTAANEFMAPVHNRMPVILTPDEVDAWIDPQNTDTKALKAMLDATPPGALMMEPVSKKINSVKNDTAEALFETQGSLL